MSEIVHVLLKKDVRLEVPAVAPVLAESLGLNVFDARRISRYARGLFLEEIERSKAETACAALMSKGIDTLIVPVGEYRELPRPRRIVTAELSDAGFQFKTDFRKPLETIPWSKLSFVSAGIVATPQYRDLLSSKSFKLLPAIYKIEDQDAKQELREKLANLSLKKRKVAGGTSIRYRNRLKEDDLEFLYKEQTLGYIDLITLDPWDRLRINRHEFRFDYLRERAGANSLENFRILAKDLTNWAKDTLISNMTMALVDGIEVHELVFDNLGEFDKYNTWFLHMGMNTLDSLGRAPTTTPEKDFMQASVELQKERRGTTIYRKKPDAATLKTMAADAVARETGADAPAVPDANPPAGADAGGSASSMSSADPAGPPAPKAESPATPDPLLPADPTSAQPPPLPPPPAQS